MDKEKERPEADKALDGSKAALTPVPAGELSEEQLDTVSGGRSSHFVFDPSKPIPDGISDYSEF